MGTNALHVDKCCNLTEVPLAAQAIFNLDRPWAASEKAAGVAGVLGRRAAAEQAHRPEALLGEFRLGEERVRHIVLGSPLAPQLATTPPAWARCVPETETPTASTSTHG